MYNVPYKIIFTHDFEDIDDDVDVDVPATQRSSNSSGRPLWFVFTLPAKKLVLIEADDTAQAKKFVHDEFGIQADNLFIQNFDTLDSALAQYSLNTSHLGNCKEYILWSRTKERKVIRSDRDGMNCDVCGIFYQYAVANLPAGKLKCYSCKVG